MHLSRLTSGLRRSAAAVRLIGRLATGWRGGRLGASWPLMLAVGVFRRLGEHHAPHMAASVSYYAVISLFPLVLALSAIMGWIAGPESRQDELVDFFVDHLPGSEQFVRDTVQGAARYRETLGVVAAAALLLAASAIFGSITRVVNLAWGLKDPPFYKSKPRQMSMALGVGILFMASVALTGVLQWAGSIEIDGQAMTNILGGQVVAIVLRLPAALVSFSIFLIIYKYLPSVRVDWRDVWRGAVLAGALFELGKSLFLWYLENFARFEQLYGNVASVVVLMIWAYVSAFILILGAEVSSEYNRIRRGAAAVAIESRFR